MKEHEDRKYIKVGLTALAVIFISILLVVIFTNLPGFFAMLQALGCPVEEGKDFLLIHGQGCGGRDREGHLTGGTVDGAGDHRIVMSAAVASALCSGPVVITGAEAVNKSYPGFFEEREKLWEAHMENG